MGAFQPTSMVLLLVPGRRADFLPGSAAGQLVECTHA